MPLPIEPMHVNFIDGLKEIRDKLTCYICELEKVLPTFGAQPERDASEIVPQKYD